MSDIWNLERDPEDLGGQFGFKSGVKVAVDYYRPNGEGPVLETTYVACLPHQCDAWEIAWSADRETAIAEMETFIREAQAALEKLKEAT